MNSQVTSMHFVDLSTNIAHSAPQNFETSWHLIFLPENYEYIIYDRFYIFNRLYLDKLMNISILIKFIHNLEAVFHTIIIEREIKHNKENM